MIYVKFIDIRETDKAFATIRHGEAHLAVQHITPSEFAIKCQNTNLKQKPVSTHEGQILVQARYHGKAQRFDVAALSHLVKEVLDHCGEIMAFRVEMAEEGLASFRVEYFDISCVEHALPYVEGRTLEVSCNHFRVWSWLQANFSQSCSLGITKYEPDIVKAVKTPKHKPGPIIIGQEDAALEQTFSRMHMHDYHGTNSSNLRATGQGSSPNRQVSCRQGTPSSLTTPMHTFGDATSEYTAPWSPSSISYGGYGVPSPIWSSYSPGAIGQERGSVSHHHVRHAGSHHQMRTSGKFGGRHQHDFAAIHHNVVDVDRIRAGLDVRTTVSSA